MLTSLHRYSSIWMNLKSQPAIKRLTYSLGYGNDINSKCRLQENLLFWLLYGGGTNFFMELIVSDCIAGERGCKEKKWTSFTCRHRYDMEPTLAESKHNTRTFFGRCSKQFGNCFTRKHKTLRRRKKNSNRARLLSFNLSETKGNLMRISLSFVFLRNLFSAMCGWIRIV